MQEPDTEPLAVTEIDDVVLNLVRDALREVDEFCALVDQKVPPGQTSTIRPTPEWKEIVERSAARRNGALRKSLVIARDAAEKRKHTNHIFAPSAGSSTTVEADLSSWILRVKFAASGAFCRELADGVIDLNIYIENEEKGKELHNIGVFGKWDGGAVALLQEKKKELQQLARKLNKILDERLFESRSKYLSYLDRSVSGCFALMFDPCVKARPKLVLSAAAATSSKETRRKRSTTTSTTSSSSSAANASGSGAGSSSLAAASSSSTDNDRPVIDANATSTSTTNRVNVPTIQTNHASTETDRIETRNVRIGTDRVVTRNPSVPIQTRNTGCGTGSTAHVRNTGTDPICDVDGVEGGDGDMKEQDDDNHDDENDDSAAGTLAVDSETFWTRVFNFQWLNTYAFGFWSGIVLSVLIVLFVPALVNPAPSCPTPEPANEAEFSNADPSTDSGSSVFQYLLSAAGFEQ
ncbi:unnamed protein product [Amoebophrya sp. A120]|nr:unnamed protein product [Amoebophrya sp. A120]|eukprot:GSA120T00012843001.1